MKRLMIKSSLLVLLLAALFACNKELQQPADETKSATKATEEIVVPVQVPPTCGNSLTTNLEDLGGFVSGTVQISNDENNYYIKISEAIADYKIETVKLIYGDENHVRTALLGLIQCGFQAPANPDMVVNYSPGQDEVLITIPIASIPMDCFYFHARVTVVKRDPGSGNILYGYDLWTDGTVNASQNPCQDYYQYCRQECEEEECGQLRTQTPGGWGAEPNGNNPGTYLHANFAAAFPAGLKVGCNGGYTISMTNAQAITNLLPTGGQAQVLKASSVNPAEIKNVLVGHLIALTLSVGFDNHDADFGQGGVYLGDMVIGSGLFANMTVSQFLAIANNVLGGCSNAYTPKQITEVATLINENYTDGIVDNGYLVCPGNR
jgi:hypothetical protein